ncbi:glycosyltransferase family 4 protein [Maridesulfovibrio hydrothermalis]|uniref:Glycosyl transferase group 1 n=1 Tax=Maridesulfovibrio hydrothermalis AM13 = DSM 14728 TaxID=1121451 RepID=L0RDU8_9BACT|nr:glycosyltransferase family 4 protein [Maridesulfovibrio hydrothermalis]CCO24909.1 Glycosyl transferase group 1 [Maridesulfovibrio hydrothermalis AM13 = DSM 14728]
MNKIALILPRFSRYGGVERFGFNLSVALADAGYKVDFICSRSEEEPPEGVSVIEVGRYGLCRSGKLLWFVLAAERARKKGNYDLCISLGKSLNQDILRIGGGALESFWKLSQRAWPAGFARTFKMLRRRTAPVNFIIKYIERRQSDSKCRIVCVSHRVKEWMIESCPGLANREIDVVYNKPDLSLFSPLSLEKRAQSRSALSLTDRDIIISTATTNFALKGVSSLIKALAELPENYHLHVAGGRNPSRYIKLAEQSGVAKRVRFLGKVTNMPEFYGRSDIFVLPSYYDACSNSVLEALACGLPVISSKDNGSSYFLPADHIIDDPSDYIKLKNMIKKFAEQKGEMEFKWPDDVACGIEPYLELIEESLRQPNREQG